MNFQVKKIDNCFADAQSYEYKLEIEGRQLISMLDGWDIRENHKYRRPTFAADKVDMHMKGVLKSRNVRVSYPNSRWEAEKAAMEAWFERIDPTNFEENDQCMS